MLQLIRSDLERYVRPRFVILSILLHLMKTPGFRAIFIYRISNRLVRSRFRFLCFALVRIMRFTCNVDIEPTAIIGSGCRIPHTFSIVIGGGSVIGNNSTIMQGVTIGGNSGKSQGRQTQPIIGNDVFIGPGAKILGPISIGHKVKIGANAVVLSNIPDSSVAVGVPAIVR